MASSSVLRTRNAVVFAVIAMVLLIFTFHSHITNLFLAPSHGNHAKISRIHYLIPSTISKPPVCASIVSALVNRYPIPVILGYKGEDEYDSGRAHIAKIPAIQRYLHSLTDADDDDIIMVMDSFDVLAQVPVEAMIERYFDIAAKADQKMAAQRGITVAELHEQGLRQTILWGAGKICWPENSRCFLIPFSGLPRYAFGPRTDDGDDVFSDPQHLNSGTVIAPLGDFRKLIDDTQRMIEDTYDLNWQGRDRDQVYISTLYARQEYQRTLDMNDGKYPIDPRVVEYPKPKQGNNDTTEYHIFVDFDSTFTQTQCHNEPWMRNLQYNNSDLTASVINDTYDGGRVHHRPFKIQMPFLIYRVMTGIFNSLPKGERLYVKPKDWVHSLPFGTNIGTEVIYSFYHNTCNKDAFMERYHKLWFFPIVKPLLRVAKHAIQDNTPLHPELIDGRIWMAPKRYPVDGNLDDEFGGVFTDFETEPFIPFQNFCQENITAVLGVEPA
ncbi:Fc.00g056490.m01.CDS01 [Cosmosporella sp. VM-42]